LVACLLAWMVGCWLVGGLVSSLHFEFNTRLGSM
jgi:hypothetical protein